jgi:hypothetical protein
MRRTVNRSGQIPGEVVMIASVHVADVGARTGIALLRQAPRPASTNGLRHADIGFAAPLSSKVRPAPDPGRVGLIAFWDDNAALDRFLADDPTAARLADGWHVRLEPLRATGTWPGLPEDLPTARTLHHDGPAAVLTLGRLRLTQTMRFLRTTAKAEGRVVEAPGLTWATGLGRPPFVATCSLWETTQALASYAYGRREPAHPDAIAAHQTEPFHHQSAFIRFRPYGSKGHLDGKNALAERWMPVT